MNMSRFRKYITDNQKFDRFDKERERKQVMLAEYQRETRKMLIENQYKLKGIISKVKQSLNAPEIDQEHKERLLRRIQQLEEDGDYKDILAIVELSKSDTYADFKKLMKSQESELVKLSPGETKGLHTMSEEQLQTSIKELDEQLAVIEEYKLEYLASTEKKEDLEGTHVILNGLQRTVMLNSITYYEMLNRFAGGMLYNPDTIKVLNDVHYNVEHNLPVLKEVGYR
jgi:hypothetical protein